MTRYPALFSPVRLGPLVLEHRAVMCGHSMRHGEQGLVSARTRAYVGARARGGAALVTIESAPVQASSRVYPQQLSLYDDAIVPGLAALADEVHAAGSRLAILLWHGGRHVPAESGYAPVAPSPVPSVATGVVPHALTSGEIGQLVRDYAAAARRCRDAGLDAVEVQTASDYLLGSFLSPTLNRRSDDYGGSTANRARIVCEIVEAVRDAVGDAIAVGLRTSAGHTVPGDTDGFGRDEAIAAMQVVCAQAPLDWVSVMEGSYWSFADQLPTMDRPRTPWAEAGAAFREALPAPIVLAGRIRTPAEAEALLADGAADVVAMARSWIADPDWAAKARRGEEERIRPCISCNQGCLTFTSQGVPGSCVVNPEAGRERELPPVERAPRRRRVAVVGGGPAGLEAARVAALRGHDVTLYEADERLGGALRLAGEQPHRGEIALALDWWERELRLLGVQVRLGERADEPAADAVIFATGAAPAQSAVLRRRPWLVDGIPGAAGLPHGRDVLAGRAAARGSVLVVDEEGGWPAVSLAEALAADPLVTAVTVVTAESRLGQADLTLTAELPDVTARLEAAGIAVHGDALVDRVDDGAIELVDGRRLGPFDAIVLSTGTEPAELPDGVLAAGDCLSPRGVWAATTDAARLARAL